MTLVRKKLWTELEIFAFEEVAYITLTVKSKT